jgi:hypothetical protein
MDNQGETEEKPRRNPMKWVTREHPKTDRIACPWLIRKYIDPDAEILYVPDAEVLPTAEREDAISFDAPGARYTHRDGQCSFEVLIADYQLTEPALEVMATIVRGADIYKVIYTNSYSAGLLAIAHGFALLELTDERQLEFELPVYDALYAWCQTQVRSPIPA